MKFDELYKSYMCEKESDDGFDNLRKEITDFNIDDFLAVMGLGKKYKPTEPKKYKCENCAKTSAYYKEFHPDTDMNEVLLYCPDCKHIKEK